QREPEVADLLVEGVGLLVPGIPDRLVVLVYERDTRRHRRNIGTFLENRQTAPQPLAMVKVVGVEDGDVPAPRLADALVDRPVGALVGSRPETYVRMLRRYRLEDVFGRVSRAVVDADDLARAHRLGEHAVDRGSDEALVVVDWDHD